MSVSSIEWTDRTWNPVRGCSRVSEGCRHCYAETMAARNLPEMRSPTTGKPFAVRTPGTARTAAGAVVRVRREARWTGAVELIPSKLDEPLHWRAGVNECATCDGKGKAKGPNYCAACQGTPARPLRVFVNSMSDLFHEALPDGDIARVWGVMGEAHVTGRGHTFQILTKRPARMLDFLTKQQAAWKRLRLEGPLPNVWLGVSVEDQATADERIPLLLQTPAAVRFVSYEPALGPVDFTPWLATPVPCKFQAFTPDAIAVYGEGPQDRLLRVGPAVDWIIVGGESGPGARPFDLAWARSAVAQCKAAGVAAFVKQLGARPELHARQSIHQERPGFSLHVESLEIDTTITLQDRKGGDPAEWPAELRVREFPA